jgi:hypothetical protein
MAASTVLVALLAAAACAQSDTAWLFRYPHSEPLAFFADDTGNVYIAGWSEKSEERRDVLLLKIDSTGHLVWDRTYGRVTATGAARDKSGNVYIAGYGGGRVCILKYTPNGNCEWVRKYGEKNRRYWTFESVAIDDSQNVYVCGAAESSSCYPVRVLKYLPNGALAGITRYTLREYEYLFDSRFHILGNGDAYLALRVERTDVDASWFVVRLAADSRVLWERVYRDAGNMWERLQWSQVDENANIYLTGDVVSAVYGTEVFCTMKMDSSGGIRWESEYLGSDSLYGRPRFLLLSKGNVYVSGWNICNKVGQEPAIAVLKYDSLGNKLWASQWGGADTSSVSGYTDENLNPTDELNYWSMSVDDTGNVYVTGTGNASSGRDYVFFAVLLKYDPQGRLVWAKMRPHTRRPDGRFDVTWRGAIVGLDKKGALYDIGIGGARGERGIYVLKYRTR